MHKNPGITDRKVNITIHIVIWAIIIIIPTFLNYVYNYEVEDLTHILRRYVPIFTSMLLFYTTYLWLAPNFFFRNKKIAYFSILIGTIICAFFINELLFQVLLPNAGEIHGKAHEHRPPSKMLAFFFHTLTSLLVTGLALGFVGLKRLKQNEVKQQELEKEKLDSELAFLKNQISPHFLFNTLNNIYSLIGINAASAQESVLKLSKLMRYLLYESEQGETMMGREIDFMNNYIDLMKLRLSPKVELKIDFPQEFTDFPIPPLLFIPFIENAFKHGVSLRDRSYVHIEMKINNNQIVFFAENSIWKAVGPQSSIQHSGIGLENVKKRLNLLFHDKHTLLAEGDGTVFRVQLLIMRNNEQNKKTINN